MFVSIGAAGLMARFISLFLLKAAAQTFWLRHLFIKIFFLQFLVFHCLISPVFFYAANSIWSGPQKAIAYAGKTLPGREASGATCIVVNPPYFFIFVSYVIIQRAADGIRSPVLALTSGSNPLHITRTDDRELVIRAEHGSLTDLEQLFFRSKKEVWSPGQKMQLHDMTITILEVYDGLPSAALYSFKKPLESLPFQWFRWQGNGYVPFKMPGIGETLHLEGAVWEWWK